MIHRHCGVLSAYGIGLASLICEKQKVHKDSLANLTDEGLSSHFEELIARNMSKIAGTGCQRGRFGDVQHEHFLEIKYAGSDYSLMVQARTLSDFRTEFEKKYFGEFGFISAERELLVEAIRVRSVFPQKPISDQASSKAHTSAVSKKANSVPVHFKSAGRLTRVDTPIWQIEDLAPQSHLKGPAIILIGTGTVVVEPGFDVFIDQDRNIFLKSAGSGEGIRSI